MGKNIKWSSTRVSFVTSSISHKFNDLPNKVEKIGFPILFVEDTNILTSHSNLI